MFDKNLNSFLQSKDSILDEIIFSIYRNFEDKRKSKKGITPSAWQRDALPLSYARLFYKC
jgi:hypothetical protein